MIAVLAASQLQLVQQAVFQLVCCWGADNYNIVTVVESVCKQNKQTNKKLRSVKCIELKPN